MGKPGQPPNTALDYALRYLLCNFPNPQRSREISQRLGYQGWKPENTTVLRRLKAMLATGDTSNVELPPTDGGHRQGWISNADPTPAELRYMVDHLDLRMLVGLCRWLPDLIPATRMRIQLEHQRLDQMDEYAKSYKPHGFRKEESIARVGHAAGKVSPRSYPKYKHDCDRCVFLKRLIKPRGMEPRTFDLYYCPAPDNLYVAATVIARYGPDGDYLSGNCFSHNDRIPELVVARKEAEKLGIKVPEYSQG